MLRGNAELGLLAFNGLDLAGDVLDRKLASVFLFRIAGSGVIWWSRKKTIVSASSCEADYISVTAARKEVIWLRCVIRDILEP